MIKPEVSSNGFCAMVFIIRLKNGGKCEVLNQGPAARLTYFECCLQPVN